MKERNVSRNPKQFQNLDINQSHYATFVSCIFGFSVKIPKVSFQWHSNHFTQKIKTKDFKKSIKTQRHRKIQKTSLKIYSE